MFNSLLACICGGERDVEDSTSCQSGTVNTYEAQSRRVDHKSESVNNSPLRESRLFERLNSAPPSPSASSTQLSLPRNLSIGGMAELYKTENFLCVKAGDIKDVNAGQSSSLDDEPELTYYSSIAHLFNSAISFSFFKKSSAAALNEEKT